MSDFKEAESLSIFDLRDRIVAQDKVIADMAEKVRLLTITVAATATPSAPIFTPKQSESPAPKNAPFTLFPATAEALANAGIARGPHGLNVKLFTGPDEQGALNAASRQKIQDGFKTYWYDQTGTASRTDEVLQTASAVSNKWAHERGVSVNRLIESGFILDENSMIWEKPAKI